ncbi:MAG: isoprenyl transferase [Chloroflexi bacterium]|nr:isoprenyl transferase [Chloroflexota bacterium]
MARSLSNSTEENKFLNKLPVHVAIIMDGNGRWAKKRHLPRLMGHRAGMETIRRVVEICAGYEIKYLTLYAFSTENWNRPELEVKGLFSILNEMAEDETGKLHKNGIQIRHLGTLDGISTNLQSKIRKAVELTKNNTRMTLIIAFNYGGRSEIIDAIKKLMKDNIPLEKLDEVLFSSYLYTSDLPDPDLIIRTGGEMRISNFLIWQSVYSEYYSTPVLWPDFNREEVDKALEDYSQRKRRFGGLDPE